MSLMTSDSTCKCEPCPLDIGSYGFKVEWEDPSFVGKQCLWHKHIVGNRGCISPDILDREPAIFVQFEKEKFPISVSDRELWEGTDHVLSVCVDDDSKRCFVILADVFFTVPVSELRRWAKLIGAKRR